ncbi:MAG: oxidoreductase [Actinomycetia bacterium]|nr:oxidoreductase [Actinomycetes bacterium]
MTGSARQLAPLDGRVAVVTGANSGIGWHVSRELARSGARVVLACRDLARGQQAADRIVADCPDADVRVEELDLASLDSVRQFAAGFVSAPSAGAGTVGEPVLDLLINNAGVMAPPRRAFTREGFELQFGTNHLGHFVLTGMLLPALLRSPAPRVVTVSSIAHHYGGADVLAANASGRYRPRHAYGNSKLANLLFAIGLQHRTSARGLPLTSTAAHPGVAYTGLFSDPQGIGKFGPVRWVAPPFVRMASQSATAGARPVLYAATEAAPGSFTGPQRMGESRGPIGPARMSALARDEALARHLWEVSEDLTGFRYPWPAAG